MELLIHIGFTLSLISFSVRKMYLLRSLLVISQTLLFLGVTNLVTEVPRNAYWYLVFISVNIYQLYRLYIESRPVSFSVEEERIYRTQFSKMSQHDFKKLMSLASWREVEVGEKLISDGESPDRLCLVYSGEVEIQKKGHSIGSLSQGKFIGEMSFLTKTEASADVVTKSRSRVIEWKQSQLDFLIDRRPHLRSEIQSVLGNDLIEKLKSQNSKSGEREVHS